MRHRLILAAAAIAVATVAVMARDVDGGSASSGAGLTLSDIAATTAMASEPRTHLAAARIEETGHEDSGPASYALGGSTATSMIVSEAQKAEIRRQLSLLGADEAGRLNLRGLAIGAKLPREKVRIFRLPSSVAGIVPKYGAYEYFVTQNGQIVIVDPSGYEVVDIIGA